MGATIAIAWLCTAWLAVLLLIQRLPDRANALAVRFGLLVGLGGMMVGFLMTMPTKAQLNLPEGRQHRRSSARTASASPTAARPAAGQLEHHRRRPAGRALHRHARPAGAAAARVPARPGLAALRPARFDRVRSRLVIVAGSGYAALTVLFVWQALRGQSVAHPDALTLAALAGLLLAAGGGLTWALARPRTVQTPAAPMLSEVH